jgi:hypothetical protein
MTAYENDVLIIPKKYKKMSVSELKKEEQKLTFIFKADFKSKGTGFVQCLVFLEPFVTSRKETVTLLLTCIARIMRH